MEVIKSKFLDNLLCTMIGFLCKITTIHHTVRNVYVKNARFCSELLSGGIFANDLLLDLVYHSIRHEMIGLAFLLLAQISSFGSIPHLSLSHSGQSLIRAQTFSYPAHFISYKDPYKTSSRPHLWSSAYSPYFVSRDRLSVQGSPHR